MHTRGVGTGNIFIDLTMHTMNSRIKLMRKQENNAGFPLPAAKGVAEGGYGRERARQLI